MCPYVDPHDSIVTKCHVDCVPIGGSPDMLREPIVEWSGVLHKDEDIYIIDRRVYQCIITFPL